MIVPYNYSIYHDFIETYLDSGFLNINEEDPIMQELKKVNEQNDQFFLVMDLSEIKVIYTSNRSSVMLGIDPEEMTPLEMVDKVHPDCLHRFGMARSKLLSMEKDLQLSSKNPAILSTDIKMLSPDDKGTINLLFQCFVFYSPTPHRAVFEIQVMTNIDSYKIKKGCFHYYSGNDTTLFKFPNEDLLKLDHKLSSREFEIIMLISTGLNSSDIAQKLFISTYTVNTHRRNILKKTGKKFIPEVIFDLMTQGLL